MAKTLQDQFSELSLEAMGETLEQLTHIHHTKKQARRDELMAELKKLGEPVPASTRVGNGKPAASRASPSAKYRDPASGATWAGRGGTPRWMQEQLKKGKKKEDFLIKG